MSSQSRIELYKEAMAIEHERAALQVKIDQLQARLENINRALFSAAGAMISPAVSKAKGVAAAGHLASAGQKPRAGRGELKRRILDALAAAGNAGIRVRDLANSLGSKPGAIHSWFQFARKNIKAIRKAGKGRYRLVGAVPQAAPAPDAAATPKAAAKAPKAAKKSSGKPRGYLTTAVQEALKTAGKDGVRINELAKTLDVNPRNLFVWFATTGKKFKAIKKTGPGQYRLN